jgi:2-amino-4-hydroxy-6-hydroxymethyldihydropteridine diphosphokinase
VNDALHRAYIGLGANLGDRAANVRAAMTALKSLGTVAATSSLYSTKPWGDPDQPEFVNAAVLLETALAPLDLLRAIKAIEVELGRVPTRRWGPRAIDLDILTYDDADIDERESSGLRVPHPFLSERAFVLVPLAEIDNGFAEMRDRLGEEELAGVRLLVE